VAGNLAIASQPLYMHLFRLVAQEKEGECVCVCVCVCVRVRACVLTFYFTKTWHVVLCLLAHVWYCLQVYASMREKGGDEKDEI
jgi:hypothetical protein